MSVLNNITNIKDIIFNSSKIMAIYEGTEQVYKSEPYTPGTIVGRVENNNTFTTTLAPGYYEVKVTGGGGSGKYSDISVYYNYYFEAGGGGANFEGIIYNPTTQNIKLYGAAAKGTSYLELGGTRMITCTNGADGHWLYYQHNSAVIWEHNPGAGGTLTVNSSLQVINQYSNSGNGQAGVENTDVNKARSSGGLSGSTEDWGVGEWRLDTSQSSYPPLYHQYGGVQLKYIGQQCTLTINPTPSDATVTLTATGYTQSGNSITVPSNTSVAYTVKKTGYVQVTDNITLTNSKTLNISLVQKLYTTTIRPIPSDANVLITAEGYTQSGNSIKTPYGTEITYTLSKEGWDTKVNTHTCDGTLTIESWMGSTLEIWYAGSDATCEFTAPEGVEAIQHDIGTGANNMFTVPTGTTVTYKVSKPGYTPKTDTITLTEPKVNVYINWD